MPLFEFRCQECEERFEELLRRSDDTDDVTCPSCGSRKVEKLQSGFAAHTGSSSSSASTGCSPRGGFS